MPPRKNNGNGPMDRLKGEAGGLVGAVANRALSSVTQKVEGATGRLNDYVEGPGGPGLMAAVTGAKNIAEGDSPAKAVAKAGMTGLKEKVKGIFSKGKSGGKQKLKLTNIVESVDVGVPVRLPYNQWTTYEDFPSFTKKVENASPEENDQEYKVNWKAQVFWSHREWEATITDQRPDERIVWKSKGQKGHVDGAVTFHELAPTLTKIVVVLEYHPQGLFERTGNLWRAQGRRVRLELKHFRRHVMSEAILHPDEVEGWRGVIEDGEVVQEHEPASGAQAQDRESGQEDVEDYVGDQDEYEDDDEPQDEYEDGDEPQDEYEDNGEARDEAPD